MMHKIYPKKLAADRADVERLLASEGIRFEENVDTTFGQYQDEELIATASTFKNIIKCVAIDSNHKGGAVFNELMNEVLNEISRRGYEGAFVYTKPMYEIAFNSIGFKEIERVNGDLIFMQRDKNGFASYLDKLEETKISSDTIGSIVLNANPFTLGHRYLVEYAAKNCNYLHLFVVSEDESHFKTTDRYNMVKAGVADLENIIMHTTDNYLVSSATFPSYFIDEDKSVTKIHATLDARIFKNHIAKVLGISKRFVGTEPLSFATNIYNETMREVFETDSDGTQLELIEIPRIEKDGEVISASRVRKNLLEGSVESIKDLVPSTTYNYIIQHKLY